MSGSGLARKESLISKIKEQLFGGASSGSSSSKTQSQPQLNAAPSQQRSMSRTALGPGSGISARAALRLSNTNNNNNNSAPNTGNAAKTAKSQQSVPRSMANNQPANAQVKGSSNTNSASSSNQGSNTNIAAVKEYTTTSTNAASVPSNVTSEEKPASFIGIIKRTNSGRLYNEQPVNVKEETKSSLNQSSAGSTSEPKATVNNNQSAETSSSLTKKIIGITPLVIPTSSPENAPTQKPEMNIVINTAEANSSGPSSSISVSSPLTRRDLEERLSKSIEEGNREELLDLFVTKRTDDSASMLLQILLTFTVPNTDRRFDFDEDVKQDAMYLLGPRVDFLNLLHLACLLGDEEISLDILDFVARESEQMEARKILLEFMGKTWGDGNTVLHLASFSGMDRLVHRLLDLGAYINKRNAKSYKAVDCADDDITRNLFLEFHAVEPTSSYLKGNEQERRSSVDSKVIPKSHSLEQFSRPTLDTSKEASPAKEETISVKTPSMPNLFLDQVKPEQVSSPVPSGESDPASRASSAISPSRSTLKKLQTYPTANATSTVKNSRRIKFDSYCLFFDLVRNESLASIKAFLEDYYNSHVPMKEGINLNYQNHMGMSVFHLAAGRSDEASLSILKYLVESSPRPMEFKQSDFDLGFDPASSGSNINPSSSASPMASPLQSFNFQMDVHLELRDFDGWTPLHVAAAEGNLEVLRYFVIDRGVDTEAVNYDDETVLDVVEDDSVAQFLEDLINRSN